MAMRSKKKIFPMSEIKASWGKSCAKWVLGDEEDLYVLKMRGK